MTENPQDILNDLAKAQERPEHTKRVFIAIPNMNQICVGLVNKLFHFAMQRKYDPWFHFITEKRHTDYARNRIAEEFLKSGCDYCFMIDADVDPHKDILSLIEYDKPIMSGNTFCWINGELMASIWERAECEQCRCLSVWLKEGKIHDWSQYRMEQDSKGDYLMRWNPFTGGWGRYANQRDVIGNQKCRCKGTGKDPFVFRTHHGLGKQLMKVDSVGSASLFVRKDVFEIVPYPWFRFLYKESGEILLTEDHYFCWKAAEMGIETWAHPQMFCSHYKTVDLLQLTATINKAYQMGKQSEKLTKSIIVPA